MLAGEELELPGLLLGLLLGELEGELEGEPELEGLGLEEELSAVARL